MSTKLSNVEAANRLATGETIDRVRLKSLPGVVDELDNIITNCQKAKRQIHHAIRTGEPR